VSSLRSLALVLRCGPWKTGSLIYHHKFAACQFMMINRKPIREECMTLSIIARDPETGAFGVASATGGPAVGALVPHTRQGFGAAATQAMTNPYLAIDALNYLGSTDAETALGKALARDGEADLRQIILVDAKGRTAGWTGAHCIGFAGHILEDGVAVAGNLLVGQKVLEAM